MGPRNMAHMHTLNFFFLEKLTTTTLPNEIIAPVCPLQLWWVRYGLYTHHLITDIVFIDKVRFMCFVPFSYFKKSFNSPQSSSSGLFTLVVINTAV